MIVNVRHAKQMWVTFVLAIFVVGCNDHPPEAKTDRWYTSSQVETGRAVFQEHCASCHGAKAEGTAEWRKTDGNGNYPPPPLNGSAHAWHHPLSVLERTIAGGGVALGGIMPGFAGTLSAEEARATIAYFQSQWPDDVYVRWRDIDSQ